MPDIFFSMITIVGAGPSGCYLGWKLSSAGHDVEIIDRKRIIGDPVQCSGVLTKDITEHLRMSRRFVLNRIKYADIVYEHGSERLRIPTNDYVVDRMLFDQEIAKKAEKSGARIRLGCSYVKGSEKGFWVRENEKLHEKKSSALVGADGPMSNVQKKNLPGQKRDYFYAKQLRIEGSFEKEAYQVHLGTIAPGFFGWVIPESETIARVGLGVAFGNPNQYLESFVRKLGLSGNIVIGTQAGIIPMFDRRIMSQKGKTYLLGDACGQVKATTGGGIIPSFRAADILARCIKNNKNYDSSWKKTLGRELGVHLRIRKVLDRMTKEDFSRLFIALGSKESGKVFSETSRDRIVPLMLRMLIKNPGLVRMVKYLF
jgi:geranylgeranyl reductase family protein